MASWNGHYVDYDYSDQNYSLEMLIGIRAYTERNVAWASQNEDHSALEYYGPKLEALEQAIRDRS